MDAPYLEPSLDCLIVALCKDYERRQAQISLGKITHRTEIELKYINAKIYDAVSEVVGDRIAEGFIDEIGRSIGYAKSEMLYFTESTYKIYKNRCKVNIAKKLHLI